MTGATGEGSNPEGDPLELTRIMLFSLLSLLDRVHGRLHVPFNGMACAEIDACQQGKQNKRKQQVQERARSSRHCASLSTCPPRIKSASCNACRQCRSSVSPSKPIAMNIRSMFCL